MPNEPIKHHYVQKAYLKRFSYDSKRVFVLRKEGGSVFASNINDVCSENNFNTRYDNKNKHDIKVELGFSKIENNYPNQLFRVIPEKLKYPYQNGGVILSKIEKEALVETVLLQLVRSKATREYGQSIVDLVYQEKLEEIRSRARNAKEAEKQVSFLERNEEIIKRNALIEGPLLFYSKDHSENLIRDNLRHRNCIIFVNHSNEPFVTSDNPVLISDVRGVIRCIYDYPLINSDSVVIYPLDPYHMAALMTPESCDGYKCEFGIIAIYTNDDIGKIKSINDAQYQCCLGCVIANSRKALEVLKKENEAG